MIFTAPLGLLALLAIPAIVAIHLFRRRFPTRHVAGLFLWQIVRQTPEGGGKISTLPITTSLILECLAALALALILAGARLSSAGQTAHLVVLLDDSASMAAVDGQGQSARDRGAQRVLGELRRLGGRARITLVRSGDRPSVLLGPAALASEASAALEQWRPEAAAHSLAMGLRLARELAGQTGLLMVVSDVPPPGDEFTGGLWSSVGAALPNIGITDAHRTLSPDDGRGTVSLTLVNHSGAPARRRLAVTAAGQEVAARELDVPAGTSSLTLPLPAGLPPVQVALSDDALARDNSVVLAEPRPQIVGVDNRLPEGRGREALTKALEAVHGVTRSASPHVAFVEGPELQQAPSPGTWRVGFGQAPAGWRAAGDPADLAGPFVLEKRHPLLLGVTLAGVVWTGATPLATAATRPLVSTGEQVLVGVAAPAGADPVIFFNLDLARTNLIRSPDWPILVSNLIEMRRHSLPGPERWNYRIGEWVRVRLGQEPKGPLRFRLGDVERTLPPGREIEFIAPAPGGRLAILEGDDVLFELGVNFLDEAEPDLRQQQTRDVGTLADVPGARLESGPGSDPLFWILLFVGGTALLVNWCLLAPRPRRA